MEIRKIIALRGPNIWARYPVLEAWVELGDLKDSPSNEIPGFNQRIMSWLPLMIEHRCSVGERGGFFERLRRGTYLAHILEHVTLELQSRAGYEFGFGRARETSKEGLFRVAVRYEDEAVGRACLAAGCELCLAAVYDRPYDVNEEIRKLRVLADDVRLGPTTRTLVNAARARDIPVCRLNSESLAQLGNGARQRRIRAAETDRTGAIAESIAQDKELTRTLLRQVGLPVPAGRPVNDAEDAWEAAVEIGLPVVVKPQCGNHGNGVVIGVSKREQIEAAYHFAVTLAKGVMVEELAHGAEHRLLVVGGKLVAATRGKPAFVIGDGRQTVRELIESQLNSDPRRGRDLSCPLWPIELDATVLLVLEQEGHRVDSVPPEGKKVIIQRNGNLAEDVTDAVHPEVARMASLAARVVGLDVAGIDIIADDISRPLEAQGGVVIEVNAGPGLQMHVEPESGTPRPVGDAIVATLFSQGEDGRIPIVAVTGAENTPAVTKLVAHMLASTGLVVGHTSADGIFVGSTRTQTDDCRDAESARDVLLNPLVEAAVFETSLESILEEGLGFDRCHVAVVTSIAEGMKLDFAEWDTPEKRSLVYRAVGDVVLPHGTLVLKAGDALGPIVAKHCPGSLVLFSTDEHEPLLQAHRVAGGKAVFARGKDIVLGSGVEERKLPEMPLVGSLEVILPAIAAASALALHDEQIVAALRSFRQCG
ncbi:MAG: cyanophycin synthetase [Planctomycetia bacterium]|nr:cyanophycin synthetase [Planctomycetia bacterium]